MRSVGVGDLVRCDWRFISSRKDSIDARGDTRREPLLITGGLGDRGGLLTPSSEGGGGGTSPEGLREWWSEWCTEW